MVAKGIRGNSFRFIGDEDEDEASSLPLRPAAAAAAAASGDEVSGTPAFSFFFCFFVEGIVSSLAVVWWAEWAEQQEDLL